MVVSIFTLLLLIGRSRYQAMKRTHYEQLKEATVFQSWLQMVLDDASLGLAIGGVWGQDIMFCQRFSVLPDQGPLGQLHFLPEQHTDFVFSVWAEEWGFLGSFVLLFLLLLLISRGLKIASTSKERAGATLAIGISAMLFWQTFINVGMVVGIVPVVGVPLPLFSYGGTSLLTTLIGIGILTNISMRRFMLSR